VTLSETLTKPRLLVLAALVLASLAVFAAKAQASEASEDSFAPRPPDAVLMKGNTTIQQGLRGSSCWSHWNDEKDSWSSVCGDYFVARFPRAPEALMAGRRLHIRVDKPERPDHFQIYAYKGFDKGEHAPIGARQRLITTLKPVKRDGDTVAWDAFFRVNEPNRDYYLDFWPSWGEENGAGFSDTHVSGGDADYTFHVKTRA
jgi:hypothetical protein